MGHAVERSGPSRWELNAVVLCHLTRFFQAATQVVRQWRDPDDELVGALLTLSGNMLWARSGFEARDRAEEQQMAYGGALVSSVAERALGATGSGRRARALALLDRLEQELRLNHDAVLGKLSTELQAAALSGAPPGQVNAAVWSFLFPRFPYAESHEQLCRRIEAQLRSAG